MCLCGHLQLNRRNNTETSGTPSWVSRRLWRLLCSPARSCCTSLQQQTFRHSYRALQTGKKRGVKTHKPTRTYFIQTHVLDLPLVRGQIQGVVEGRQGTADLTLDGEELEPTRFWYPGQVQLQKGLIYLKALNSAFEEHKEGGVWINGLSFLKNGLGFLQAPPGVCAIQSKEGQHDGVVPQKGQAERAHGRWWTGRLFMLGWPSHHSALVLCFVTRSNTAKTAKWIILSHLH